MCYLSSEILNDSALNLSNQLAVSIARKVAEFEDKSFFLGTGRPVGLAQTAGASADATFDAANANWGGWTLTKLQDAKAKLPGWALEDPNLAFVCNPSFYESVLKVNAYSAGGTPGDAILNGTSVRAWDGVPVVFSNVMPRGFLANQIVAYLGSFPRATKFGVVRGSEQIATSNDFRFDTDEVAIRYTQRWDYALHDVTGTNSGIIALKD
jgi:HK97 family phage major capsid protein